MGTLPPSGRGCGLTIGCRGCGAVDVFGRRKVLRAGPAPLTLGVVRPFGKPRYSDELPCTSNAINLVSRRRSHAPLRQPLAAIILLQAVPFCQTATF
jgi:hypothetical protein